MRCEWTLSRRMPQWLRRWKVASWRLGSAKAVSDRWGLMPGPSRCWRSGTSFPFTLSSSRLSLIPPPRLCPAFPPPCSRGLVSFQQCRWRGILLNLINYRTMRSYVQGVSWIRGSLKILTDPLSSDKTIYRTVKDAWISNCTRVTR